MRPKASAPTMIVRLPRGGRREGAGRTRLSQERMSSVSTWLPASAHDKLVSVAKAQEVSVAEVVRNVLILNIVNLTVIQNR